jgi:hypothetical protein
MWSVEKQGWPGERPCVMVGHLGRCTLKHKLSTHHREPLIIRFSDPSVPILSLQTFWFVEDGPMCKGKVDRGLELTCVRTRRKETSKIDNKAMLYECLPKCRKLSFFDLSKYDLNIFVYNRLHRPLQFDLTLKETKTVAGPADVHRKMICDSDARWVS